MEAKTVSGWREVMSRFLNVLRSWLVMVSIIAIGNTLQSFRDHTFLYEKLYTGKPDLVNGLQARTFGIWTLLSSVIRCLCAIDIHNKTLYHITLWTFLLALGHFLSELFVFGTAAPTIGVLAPLMVASFSILGMLAGLRYLEAEPSSCPQGLLQEAALPGWAPLCCWTQDSEPSDEQAVLLRRAPLKKQILEKAETENSAEETAA
ncbi:hypothetical protein GH733_002230 [Mirounga leonina]|nr:hypothetical protein GH733_002230 [Mirounga leonina]